MFVDSADVDHGVGDGGGGYVTPSLDDSDGRQAFQKTEQEEHEVMKDMKKPDCIEVRLLDRNGK